MVDLLVRNLAPDIESAIKAQSKQTGRSVSDVAQSILRKGLVQGNRQRGLASEIRALVDPDDFVDLQITREMDDRPPPDFS